MEIYRNAIPNRQASQTAETKDYSIPYFDIFKKSTKGFSISIYLTEILNHLVDLLESISKCRSSSFSCTENSIRCLYRIQALLFNIRWIRTLQFTHCYAMVRCLEVQVPCLEQLSRCHGWLVKCRDNFEKTRKSLQ